MRNISNKNFITEGDKSLSRQLRRRAEKEIARIDELHVNDTNRHYIKKIFIAHGTWIEYKHFSDDQIKVTIHTPTGETNLDPINGLASGTRYFIKPSGGFGRFFDRDEGLIYPKKVTDSIHPWLYSPPAIGAVDVFMKTPGKYTGEMRKVIQALIATGQHLYYEYKAGLCHGVYTADNDSKWIIEISAQGIFASPMPLTEEPDAHTAWLGYSPLGPTDDDLNFKRIAGSAMVTPFFSKSPVFNACGWAFNIKGNEIQNCAVVSGSPSIGYRYQISITEENNEPTLGVMVELEAEPFALVRYYGMKVPDYAETGLEQTSNQDGQSGVGTYDAPRYVFYDGNDVKVVRSQGHEPIVTDLSGKTSPYHDWWPYYIGGHHANVEAYAPGNPALYPGSKYYVTNGGVGSLTSTKAGTVVTGYDLLASEYGDNMSVAKWSKAGESLGNVVISRGLVTALVHPHYETARMTASLYKDVNGLYDYHLAYCIIPLGDREAVYQYRWNKTENGEFSTWTQSCCVASRSTYWEDEGSGHCRGSPPKYPNCCPVGTVYEGNGYFESLTDMEAKFCATSQLPVENAVWCRPNPATDFLGYYTYDYGSNDGGQNNAKLSIVASGNIDELLWTDNSFSEEISSYNADPSPEAPQWMYVHRDNTQNGKVFGAKYMNATTYSKQFIIGIDETKYPMASLPNFTINTFWVGDPHCVNNDCEE